MNILHTVEQYYPALGGMAEVVRQLSERLVSRGHAVTVATSSLPERQRPVINGVMLQEFPLSGSWTSGVRGDVIRYADFLLHADFDVVTNFAAQQWASDVMLPMLDRIRGKKVFVPTGFSGLYLPEYADYFTRMCGWMKQYDMNVFLSDDYRDINFARQHGVTKTSLIPNGAAADEFLPESQIDIRRQLGIATTDLLILHVGSHTGSKGHADAMNIFRLARIRNATLVIVGNPATSGSCQQACLRSSHAFNRSPWRHLDHKRVLVASLSRPETVAAYKAADLFLFPSNIECSPIVLFECMAARTPFLTTDVGNAAEIVGWSDAGVVLPTVKAPQDYGRSHACIRESAVILADLAQDAERRERMAARGFAAWQERFTWEGIAQQYEKLYQRLLKGGHN
jgi:glycosyltransferase involved in cell wall biosynthesis